MAVKLNSEFNYRYQVIGETPWEKIKTLKGFLEGRVRAAHIRERMRALGPTVRLDLGKQAEGKGAGFAAPEGE